MVGQEQDRAWPPHIGDLAQVRTSGLVGEVVAIFNYCQREWYILALIVPTSDDPDQAQAYAREMSQARVSYPLEELLPCQRRYPLHRARHSTSC
jgi:hypothetical protein